MYESMNGAGVNRLPRSKADAPAATGGSTLGKTIATTAVQALVLVAAIKLVDVLIEIAVSKFRKPRHPAQARHEEHAVA